MGSIFDDYELTKEKLEGAIGVGMKPAAIYLMFRTTSDELDKWCRENYGPQVSWAYLYDVVRQQTYAEFLDAVKALGIRGNPSALAIINNRINDEAAEEKTVKIVFQNDLKMEDDADKVDSGGTDDGK